MKRSCLSRVLVAAMVLTAFAEHARAEESPQSPVKLQTSAKAQSSTKSQTPAKPSATGRPEPPAKPPETFRSKLLKDPNVDRSRKDFKQCQQAAAEVSLLESSYASGKATVANLLTAERKLTATQIHYMAVANNWRGPVAMRELLARQGEVAALERGLANTTALADKVSDGDLARVQEEMKLYQEALTEARREQLRAEYAWKAASRADQLRYLNRNQDPR